MNTLHYDDNVMQRRKTAANLPWVLEYRDVERLLDEAILQETPAPYGAVLWHSALVASAWLLGRELRGQRVVDLGAGNGLCALTAAQRGAKTWAFDIDANALKLVQGAADSQSLHVETAVFDVFDEVELPRCDLLVVADVLYEPELAARVADQVVEAHRAGASVLVADPQRYSRKVFCDRTAELGVPVEFVDERHTFEEREQVIGLMWLEA